MGGLTGMNKEIIENELSTGLVIAGAYADKLRRTLFAQLRDYVRKNRELGKEIARAAGEINRLLYYILVDELKSDKGDVVRIRVKYAFDPEKGEIEWKYDTLRLEYFKRVPDEKVMETVNRIIKEKLGEVKEEYKRPQAKAAKTEETWGAEETIGISEGTQPLEKTMVKPGELKEKVAKAEKIGETLHGGIVFKLEDNKGESLGLAVIEPRAGGYYIEAILVEKGKAFRTNIKAALLPGAYAEDPSKLVEEIKKAEYYEIPPEEAKEIMTSKMEEIA
jgi:hypothetical protein